MPGGVLFTSESCIVFKDYFPILLPVANILEPKVRLTFRKETNQKQRSIRERNGCNTCNDEIKTHKMLKRMLFIMTKYNMPFFGASPFSRA